MHNKINFKLLLLELMILLVMKSGWNFFPGNFDKISTIDNNIIQAIDEEFVQIFDGETLKNLDGDPAYWRSGTCGPSNEG